MNSSTVNYRYNYIEFWRTAYIGFPHNMSREEFFRWCIDFENLSDFMGVYFDWAANGFSDETMPRLEFVAQNKFKWGGGENG